MLRLILVIVALSILLSGCVATKVMVGISEPNLAEIKPLDKRSKAEKILGKRLWHVGVADGLTFDIYQYEEDKPPRPSLGVLVLVMEFITFGIGELQDKQPPWLLTPVKQVAVAYDGQDRVVFVSTPWPVEAVGPCRRQRYLIPADYGVPVTASPEPLIGLARSTPNTAKLELQGHLFGWYPVSVDGHEFKEKVVELPSGKHEISDRGVVANVELMPGRLYRMNSKLFSEYNKKSKWIHFIEDVNSGEALHCVPPGLY